MEQYLIDTNIVSDYLSASITQKGMALLDDVMNAIPKISIITQIELLCWNTDQATLQYVKEFINDSIILEINSDVVYHCVSIRNKKKIKTPDAIIAATALGHSYTLITNNEKDFVGIQGLKVLNPFKLE
ncbi:MAG: type II toxin-antitoxin system VapC family toxin [Saprospiraceae bacterium]|jgi:predicted nucleic acid-binding protein|nr:type II toxin-antitoxin system VapC family toxin [Saprospiraceae bacterium]